MFFRIVAQIKMQIKFSVELYFSHELCAYAIIVIKERFSHMPTVCSLSEAQVFLFSINDFEQFIDCLYL